MSASIQRIGGLGKIAAALLPHLAFCCWLLAVPLSAQAKNIIDMRGQTVSIPDAVSKVVAVSPPGTYLLYAVDPQLIGGLNFPPREDEKKYTVREYGNLPVIGGMAGQSRTLNREVLLQIHPDFILFWAWKDDAANRQFLDSIEPLHIPVVSVQLDSINDYPDALQFLADILDRGERGKVLHEYASETLKQAKMIVSAIPEDRKPTVYYAEGTDGMSTEKADSLHAELIPLAGGINVHKGEALDRYGMEKVSMEQILLYDPEFIVVKEKAFFDTVYSDPRWKNIRAVREHQVYLIPSVPFNWFDRPPSFMRLLGIKWLLHILHPDIYRIDMESETKTFYKLFLGVDLSDEDAGKVLNQ